jgi:hypothetical protein
MNRKPAASEALLRSLGDPPSGLNVAMSDAAPAPARGGARHQCTAPTEPSIALARHAHAKAAILPTSRASAAVAGPLMDICIVWCSTRPTAPLHCRVPARAAPGGALYISSAACPSVRHMLQRAGPPRRRGRDQFERAMPPRAPLRC